MTRDRAVVFGGLTVGLLDGLDAVIFFGRGLGILGFSVMGLFGVMGGFYLVGFGLIGVAVALGYTLPWETKWVKSI